MSVLDYAIGSELLFWTAEPKSRERALTRRLGAPPTARAVHRCLVQPNAAAEEPVEFPDEGVRYPRLLVVRGRLRVEPDPHALVEALLAELEPGAEGRGLISEAMTRVRDRLAVVGQSYRALRRLVSVLREAWQDEDELSSFTSTEKEVTEDLLAARRYRALDVLGGEHIAASLEGAGLPWTLPLYLPAEAGRSLPMLHEIAVRALVELRPRQLPMEACPVAGQVVALARELEASTLEVIR